MFIPATPRLTFDRGRDWKALWPANSLLFTRARFALAAGMRALAARHSLARVWIPAYLCGPVPDAVRAAGLEPELYDIDRRLAPRYDSITPAPGDALLVVYYFGLVPPLQTVQSFAADHALPVIEDCAHALPSPDGRGAGSVGQIAAWSLRKLGPLPGGGLLTVRDPRVRLAITAPAPCWLPDPRTLARLAIMSAERFADTIGANPLRVKNRFPVLDRHPDHDATTPAPMAADEYIAPPRPSRLVRALLERADWGRVLTKRRTAWRALVAELPHEHVPIPDPTPQSVPESFPIVVSHAERIAVALRERGIEAMRWPGAEQFTFDRTRFPGAAFWIEQTLCLPLGTALTPSKLRAFGRVVRETLAEHANRPATPDVARAA